jgi:hypothetical protein
MKQGDFMTWSKAGTVENKEAGALETDERKKASLALNCNRAHARGDREGSDTLHWPERPPAKTGSTSARFAIV